MTEVLVCGSAVMDVIFNVNAFPTRAEKYRASDANMVGGGCAGNAAVAIARLGGTARLAARMGHDLIGDLTLKDLDDAGVDTSLVARTEGGKSAFSSVYVDPTGERQIMAFRGSGLADSLSPDDLGAPAAVLADTRWPGGTTVALQHARTLDVPGVLDGEEPVLPEHTALASHVAFSVQGLRAFSTCDKPAEGLRRVSKNFAGWACVTHGAEGVWYTDGDDIAHVPAYAVDVADTLGAGDVWHGAFTLSLAEGQGEADAIRFANAAAALKCTRPGGRSGAPTRAETEDFMKRNSICN